MKKKYDQPIIYIVLALLVIGWIMVYSSSAVVAKMTYNDSFKFLKKQLLFSLIGLIGMVAAMRIDYRRWMRMDLPSSRGKHAPPARRLDTGAWSEPPGGRGKEMARDPLVRLPAL